MNLEGLPTGSRIQYLWVFDQVVAVRLYTKEIYFFEKPMVTGLSE